MTDLTIVTLCQALANITHNRCHLVENSHTCRCIDDIMGPSSMKIFYLILTSNICFVYL